MALENFQATKSKFLYKNEVIYVCLFASSVTVNKYVLSELKFTVPTVFQGWQTLFCVILLSVLIKFKKIANDLQILDSKALSLLLPGLVCFAFGIVAGSKALASLPVPVFLAVTNLYPALLLFLFRKNNVTGVSLKICASAAIIGTVIIIVMYKASSKPASPMIWLLGHIFLNSMYFLYLNKLNLDLTHTTQIYYRNIFSVIVLLPISVYLDVLHLPSSDWEFYVGCLLSGILGTLLQIWTFKVNSKVNYLQFEGLAKVISSLVAYKLFFTEIEPFIWIFIIANFLICAAFLKNEENESENKKSKINLSLPFVDLKKVSLI